MEKDNNKQQQQQPSSSSSSKLRNKILKILPKAAAAVTVTFQNPPFSPGRSAAHSHRSSSDTNNSATSAPTSLSRLKHGHRGFSGPIISMIPDEARRKPKHGGSGIEAQEPTSPKVSCIGQIKHKKNKNQINKHNAKTMSLPTHTTVKTEEKKKQVFNAKKFQRMFFYTGKPKTGTRKTSTDAVSPSNSNSSVDFGDSDKNAPPIGYMRRFASGRETFANFDWKAQIAPEEIPHRDCFSEDDVDAEEEDDEDDEEEEDEVMIPFSAPIFGGGGKGSVVDNLQPRKEINLWKRRTMAPPRPLQLKPVLTAK